MRKSLKGIKDLSGYQHKLLKIVIELSLIAGIVMGIFIWPSGGFSSSAVEVHAASQASEAASTCYEQVNDSAFGLYSTPYNSEDIFDVLVYNNQLYVGMEADNVLGARIWRTKSGVITPMSQADWEEVAADAEGNPFGDPVYRKNDHIDSLAEFNGYLYASTADGTNDYGTGVFRSPTGAPGTWEDAIAAYGRGFGDDDNINFKDMQVFQGWLCGGTQNWATGAQVWCTLDGTSWEQKNIAGFGKKFFDTTNRRVWSGLVFNNALYFGVGNKGQYSSDPKPRP